MSSRGLTSSKAVHPIVSQAAIPSATAMAAHIGAVLFSLAAHRNTPDLDDTLVFQRSTCSAARPDPTSSRSTRRDEIPKKQRTPPAAMLNAIPHTAWRPKLTV